MTTSARRLDGRPAHYRPGASPAKTTAQQLLVGSAWSAGYEDGSRWRTARPGFYPDSTKPAPPRFSDATEARAAWADGWMAGATGRAADLGRALFFGQPD